MRGVALVAVAGCLAAVSAGCPAVGSAAGGPVVSYHGYGGTAIVSADGRTVTVGEFGASCPATVRAVARESINRVALFLRFVTPASPATCPQAAAPRVPSQEIRLRAPLGSRMLVNGATGRATAWISARLVLRPTVLPTGYRLFELIPAVDLARAQSPGPAGCVQSYGGRTLPNELVIVQSAGGLQVPGPGKGGWTPIRVRGHPGRAARNLITWRENGLTDYILVGPGPPGPQALSTQQLIAIADSAPA